MKLKVFEKAGAVASRTFSRVVLKGKKYSPEILMVAGTVSVVAGVVLCCKSTLKIEEVLDEHAKIKDDIHEYQTNHPNSEVYTEEDARRDKAISTFHAGRDLVKLYAPGASLVVLGVGCFAGSYGILRRRNIALTAAFNGLQTAFAAYRERVRDAVGAEAEDRIYRGMKLEEVLDAEGKGTGQYVEVQDPHVKPGDISPYAKFFDEYNSTEWHRDADRNLFFLKRMEKWANEKLKSQGHLFLNEVYDMLGIQRTAAGQFVGWVYEGSRGDGYVSFGIYDTQRPGGLGAADFVNGRTESILLDFNVDGIIYDLIEKKEGTGDIVRDLF